MVRRTRQAAFSMIEMLVVIAIISILMAMYLPILSKAKKAAMKAAGVEAMRQGNIGRMADNANIAHPKDGAKPTREQARMAYRQPLDTGKSTIYVTEMLYVVRDDKEFEAYWYTLIDPYADFHLEYDEHGNLLAQDGDGNIVPLSMHDSFGAPRPYIWEYISTVGAECSSDEYGTNVMFSDSHVERIRYPERFPASRIVAELSHEFLARS